MTPQLFVFDLAGTTVKDNRDVHRVLQWALAEHGVAISTQDANDVMGIPKPIAIESLLVKRHTGRKPISESWIVEIHELFVSKMKEFYLTDPNVRETEGASETFSRLKSMGAYIVVDTGFDREITNPLLQRMGWMEKELVDFSITSDEVPRGRPYPDMIHKAMQKFGITDPARVVKVGDTPSDMMEGTSARCGWVIGITSGAFSREQLVKENHTHLVENIPAVLEVTGMA